MKYQDNIEDVAALQPDYLGFIFYEKSSRFFDGEIPELPDTIKKVGVFVDEQVEFISRQIGTHSLSAIQLHGHESPEMCRLLQSTGVKVIKVFSIKNEFDFSVLSPLLQSTGVKVIKVFSIKNEFDFSVLSPYEEVCDYFLFDTKGKLPGGNGYTFNWALLKNYPSTKPFFLSGGIGLEESENLKEFLQSKASKYCYAIDVNSKFEIEPGLKDIGLIQEFKKIRHFE